MSHRVYFPQSVQMHQYQGMIEIGSPDTPGSESIAFYMGPLD